MKNLFLILSTLTVAIIASCSTSNNNSTASAGLDVYRNYNRPATLPTNRSNVKVKVSLSNQMVYVMEGSNPLLVMPVSIGRAEKSTPTGNFRIYNKNHHRRANTHGYAYQGAKENPINAHKVLTKHMPAGHKFLGTPMPYWCEFKSGYGFHTGWLKPYPASSGCLRMHENVAPKFFQIVSTGTPVNIANYQPEDSTLGQNIPRPPNADPFPDYPPTLRMSSQIFTHHQEATFTNR